jgi:integrase
MSIKEIMESNHKTYLVYVNGFDRRGKRIQMKRRGIKSKREAEIVEFELKRQLAEMKERPVSYTWDEWFKVCVERMRVEMKPTTILNYTGKNTIWLKPFLKGKDLKTITGGDIHDIVYNPAFNVSWHTRKTTLKIVKRILQMAVEEGVLNRNPALKVKVKVPQAKQAVLNATEIQILLREAKILKHRFFDVWALALLTGMRSGELYALEWSDVDFDTGRIVVSRSWSSKNGTGPTKTAKNRIVPISSELHRFLHELKARDPNRNPVLPRLSEWENGEQAQVLKDFCQAIGITLVKFHDLRATFITQLLSKGVSLAAVMAIVGHSSLRTTQGYLRLAGVDLVGATEKLGVTLPSDANSEVIDLNAHMARKRQGETLPLATR